MPSLDERWRGSRFFRTIQLGGHLRRREPEVVVSFADWHAGHVTPARFMLTCD